MKISVFGLGYVGSVSAACLAALGHDVVGVDVNPTKVELINGGQSPMIETGLNELIAEGRKASRLVATTDASGAIMASEVSLICVGTPCNVNGKLNLAYVERVCYQIGEAIRSKQDYHVIVIRSTVLPGSTEEALIPILETASGKRAGRDFGVCFNPEFLREGTAIQDFRDPPFTIIGEHDSQGAETAAAMYTDLSAPLRIVPLKVAEMVKYANNAFHALKVAFANEIGNICKRQGVDSHQVMDLFCMDNKLNLSPYYLKPGFAFGGSCLPKDLRALLYQSRHLDLRLPVLEAILPSNELQVRKALGLIEQVGRKKIGVLGFSFKAGTDDLRESPLVQLIEALLGKGYQVSIYDRNVHLAHLHGANRAYIEREIPHIASLMYSSAEQVLEACEVVVIGNKSPEFASILHQLRPGQAIVDLVRMWGEIGSMNGQYEGICW